MVGSREGASSRSRKILIVAPAWVGDMVMAHCLVQLLLDGDSQLEIDMLSPPATEPLAHRMPGVSRSWLLEVGHGELGLRKRLAASRRLMEEGYHQAIVLPNSFKSALVPFWARIPVRVGWLGEFRVGLLNDWRRLDPERYPLMIERFMALALPESTALSKPYPAPRLVVDAGNRDRLLREHQLATSGGVVALCPGAEFGSAKRWPAQHYATLARHAVAKGRQVWLLGSANDRTICDEIESQVPAGCVNLAGRTGLVDAIDLLSRADHVVCNDSGLMHVACALDVPTTALFGSTSPNFTPPLGRESRVLSLELPCRPCFKRECPLGHLRCLTELRPERVIEQL